MLAGTVSTGRRATQRIRATGRRATQRISAAERSSRRGRSRYRNPIRKRTSSIVDSAIGRIFARPSGAG